MSKDLIHSQDDLVQKSEKWLNFRREGIGSSEISVLLGTAPKIWLNDMELFLCKMGREFSFTNEYIENGNRFEDKARKLVELYYKRCQNGDKNKPFCSNVYDRTLNIQAIEPKFEQFTVQHKDFPYIFSSYDGLSIDSKLVLEIKCPSEKVFTKLLKNREPKIPKMYLPQVQFQLEIANSHFGITQGIFAIYYDQGVYFTNKLTKETNLVKIILIETQHDAEYCKELQQVCAKFYDMMQSKCWNKDWREDL